MAELDRLASGLTIDDVKRRLFVKALPERISTAISHISGTTEDLVKAANKSWSQAGDPVAVTAISGQPQSGQNGAGGAKWKQRTGAGGSTEQSEICPFYAKYGERARRCLPTCPWWKGKPRQQVFAIEEECPETNSGNV